MVWAALPTGKRGRQPVYTDAAVQTCLTLMVLFGMALRQTTGFVESPLRLFGLDWDMPDLSTLSRRQKTLVVHIPNRVSQGPLYLLIDSTGIKVEGEHSVETKAIFARVLAERGENADVAQYFAGYGVREGGLPVEHDIQLWIDVLER